jgi:hypothetical protein
MITSVWLTPCLAMVTVCVALVVLGRSALRSRTGSGRRRYWISVLLVEGVVTVVRVLILWYVTYRAFVHKENLSELPLMVLLMPELLLAPGDPVSPRGMWTLTGLLVVGSALIVSLLAALVWKCYSSPTSSTLRSE